MLPASIRTLTINMHYPCASIVDMVALGTAVLDGDFSLLKDLRVQVVFAEPSEHVPIYITPPPNGPNPSLLALGARLSGPEWSPSGYRKEMRKTLAKAFDMTNVTLDVDCFSRCLYRPANLDCLSPHEVSTRPSVDLVYEEE